MTTNDPLTWDAPFIAAVDAPSSAPVFSNDFELCAGHGQVASARLGVTCLGVCEAWLNGRRVSSAFLTPGWTSYEWRLHRVEYDVTDLLEAESSLSILVGDGWYRGRLGWIPGRPYGERLAVSARLDIEFADGYRQRVLTDDTWQCGPSNVLSNSLYDGQTIDARCVDARSAGPVSAGATDWGAVEEVPYRGEVTLDPAPEVRALAELAPISVVRQSSGALLADFGENLVGWVRVRVRGDAGTEVVLRHAEVLVEGELATEPLRSASATDKFVLSGGDDVFEPTFTFHGFRYVEVQGWPETVDPLAGGALTAVVIGSDLRRIGTFECSVPELNQFHENVVRGMRGNFVDIPTDCPQRDERMGWTGDLAVFAPTAVFLFDCRAMLGDWLVDLRLEQDALGGVVPYVVPDVLKYLETNGEPGVTSRPTAIWGDAAAWVPWALWWAYGDPSVLRDSLDSMAAHGRQIQRLLSDSGVWDKGFQFGDWVDPDAPLDDPAAAKADAGVVATACAHRTFRIIAEAGGIVGRTDVAAEFEEAAAATRAAFRAQYIVGERIVSDCVTVYALAIEFGLLDADQMGWAGERLRELVAASGYRIASGFAGTPFVNDALIRTGHISESYRLLLQRECPSWLYPVTMGATTVWERWDSMRPDGSICPGGMTSFNHYALGSVADHLHRVVGGLGPLEPGYRRILLSPKIGPGVDWARTVLETPLGTASLWWRRRDEGVELDVVVPEGAEAVVRIAGTDEFVLAAGRHQGVVVR